MWLINLIPASWRWFLFCLFCAGLIAFGFVKGQANTQIKWDKSVIQQKELASQIKQDQADATVQVITQYVDRIQVVKQHKNTLINEVTRYVQADTPDLPTGFRLLHDAAATGRNVGSTGSADAQPVSAQDIASTVVENYGICRETTEQLSALQFWIVMQSNVIAAAESKAAP